MMQSYSESEHSGHTALAPTLPLAAKLKDIHRWITGVVRIGFALLLCCLPLSEALAQDANPFNGTWVASFKLKDGSNSGRIQVVIADGGGSWLTTRYRNNVCTGKEYPLTVKSHSATEIVFEVDESEIKGCAHFVVTAKTVDANTLDGTFTGGLPLKLVRK